MIKPILRVGKRIIRRLHKDDIWDTEVFPSTIVIELTNYCNLKCSMCAHEYMTRKRGRMDKQLAMKIIDEITIIKNRIRLIKILNRDLMDLYNQLDGRIQRLEMKRSE